WRAPIQSAPALTGAHTPAEPGLRAGVVLPVRARRRAATVSALQPPAATQHRAPLSAPAAAGSKLGVVTAGAFDEPQQGIDEDSPRMFGAPRRSSHASAAQDGGRYHQRRSPQPSRPLAPH